MASEEGARDEVRLVAMTATKHGLISDALQGDVRASEWDAAWENGITAEEAQAMRMDWTERIGGLDALHASGHRKLRSAFSEGS